MIKMASRVLAPLLVLALSACDSDSSWRTTDVAGVLPPLEFQLTSEDGEMLTEQAVTGGTTAVFFGYTNCPDVCPVTLAKLRNALSQIPEPARDDLTVLFVSIDPARDTPEVMATYTEAFGPQFIGLTGSEETLRQLTKRYRATFSYGDRSEPNYPVSHPSAVYVFDGKGRAKLLVRADDPVEAIAHDLRRMAAGG